MGLTKNIGLATISSTDDMSVYDFFQELAGNGENSNMAIIDAEIKDLKDSQQVMDPGGVVEAAGGIPAYVQEAVGEGGKEEIFLTTVKLTDGVYSADHTYAEILDAKNSGKICLCKYGNVICLYRGYFSGSPYYQSFSSVATSGGLYIIIDFYADDTITYTTDYCLRRSQLSSSVTSASTTTPANSAAVKAAYDKAAAAAETLSADYDTSSFTVTTGSIFLSPDSIEIHVRKAGGVVVVHGYVTYTANAAATICMFSSDGYVIPKPAVGLCSIPFSSINYPYNSILDGTAYVNTASSSGTINASLGIGINMPSGFSKGSKLFFSFAYAV